MKEHLGNELSNLTTKDWIERLQDYYLKVDGAYGNTPLTSLDVTPAGLASAIGLSDYSDEQIQNAFMALFNRKKVRDLLGTKISPVMGARAYQNFHYLILSCLVAATTTNAGDSNQYRERLGVLLNDGHGQEQGVSGINSLWLALSEWVSKQADCYRKIILPKDIGNMTVIGYAVKLAYPSRDERAELKRIIKNFPNTVFANQHEFLDCLSSASSNRLSERMQRDIDDLVKFYRFHDDEKFATHYLWRLIETILIEIENSDINSQKALLWSITAHIGGWDDDELEISLSKGNRREDLEAPYWQGGIYQLSRKTNLPPAVQKLLKDGCIILAQSHDGYRQDDRKMTEEKKVIILSCIEAITSQFLSLTKFENDWCYSEITSLNDALKITNGRGLAKSENKYNSEIQIVKGIKLGKNKWLSRIGYLPQIILEPNSSYFIVPSLETVRQGDIVTIFQACPTGEFRITQTNSTGIISSKRIEFCKDAPIAHQWGKQLIGYEIVKELEYQENGILNNGNVAKNSEISPSKLDDILEALYAGAGSSKLEGEIIQIIKRGLPNQPQFRYLAWDILRSLEEAGWLEQYISSSWRGRIWRVLPPQIVITSSNTAIIEGAVATKALELLKVEASRLGIKVSIDTTLSWAVPIVELMGNNLKTLAENLNWRCITANSLCVKKAPLCWAEEKRDTIGYRQVNMWQPKIGLFIRMNEKNSQDATLTRWTTERDRDIFVNQDKKGTFITSQRNVALLDFYQKNEQALFVYKNGRLHRQPKNGHLPLPIAQSLRRLTAKQTGIYFDNSNQSAIYQYPATDEQVIWLESIFGRAIQGFATDTPTNHIIQLAKQRHRGKRISYY